LKGALWGAAAPTALETATGAGRAYFGRLEGALDPSGAAAGRTSPLLQEAEKTGTGALTPQQWAEAQARGQPVMLGDLGDQQTRDMIRAIGNKYPEATQTMRTALRDRNLTQASRFNDYIQKLFPGQDLNTAAADDQRAVETRAMNQKNYQQAYSEGANGVWDENLAHLLRYPQVQSVLSDAQLKATKWSLDHGLDPPPNPFVQNANGTWDLRTNPDGSRAVPNLMYWDQIKRSLGDAEKQAGIGTEASRDWSDLRTRLTSTLDANPTIPSYATARKGAFDAFNTDKVSEAATNFLGAKDEPTINRQMAALRNMSPADREVFARSLAAQVRQAAANPSEVRNIANMFNNDATRGKFVAGLNTASDPQRAQKIEAFMRTESAMNQLEGAFGNSTTVRQQLTAQLAEPGGKTGQPGPFTTLARHALPDIALGSIAGGGEALHSGGGWGTAAAAFGAAAFNEMMNHASEGINKKVVTEVSRKLTSGNPDDVQQAMNFVAKTPKMMDALRRVEGSVSFWGGANQRNLQ
jgi:hypothetical protein